MTTQHASELLAELLQNLMDATGEPPEANCSCHLSPPCSDCVDYGGWREVFSACQSAIARATMATPSTSPPLTSELREALKDMCAEFRALDLPYGSKAYSRATAALNSTPSTSQPVSADLLKALKAHEAIAAAIKGGA